jgi:uncharacterized membrane protein (DUF106 family)
VEVLFIGLWVGLTLRISLSVVFTILKPIVTKDTTGISMIVIAIIVGLLDIYIGHKIFDKKIKPWLEKRKKKRNFP